MIRRFNLACLMFCMLSIAHGQLVDPIAYNCNNEQIFRVYEKADSLNKIVDANVLLAMAQQALIVDSLERATIYLRRIVDRTPVVRDGTYFAANILLHYACKEQLEINQLKLELVSHLDTAHSIYNELLLFDFSTRYQEGQRLQLDSLLLPILTRQRNGIIIPFAYIRSYNELITFYESKNDSEMAILAARQLLEFTETHFLPCSKHIAYALSVLGFRMTKFNRIDSAEYIYAKAYQLYKSYHPYDTDGLGNNLYAHVLAVMRKGGSNEAIEILKKEIPFIEAINNDEPALPGLYIALGVNYNRLGQRYEAIQAYQKALLVAERVNENYLELKLVCYGNIANIYLKLAEYDKALSYLNQAREDCLLEFGEQSRYMANTYSVYSQLYHDKKDWEKCNVFAQKNVDVISALYGNDHYQLIDPLRNLGLSFKRLGRLDDALLTINNALQIALDQIGENHYMTARLYKNIAAILIDQQRFDEALLVIQSGYTSLDCNGQIRGCLDPSIYLALLGEELRIQLHPQYSVSHLDSMVSIIREGKEAFDYLMTQIPTISNMADQAKLFEWHHENAMLAMVMVFESSPADTIFSEAMAFIEKTKNFDLLGYMQFHASDIYSQVPADTINKLNNLQQVNKSLQELLAGDQLDDDSVRSAYRDSLVTIQEIIQGIENNLLSAHPDYYKIRTESFELNVAEFQQSLDDKTALLDYTLTDSFLITFIITKKSIQTERLPITRYKLAQQVEEFKDLLSNPREDYSDMLESLSLLTKPLNELTNGISRVIIVPDNHTFGLPFDLLLLHGQPLWKRFDISYANSASIYLLQSRNRKYRNNTPVAAFAPTYNSKVDTTEETYFASLVRGGKWRLPFAEQEARSIAKALKGASYIGERASKEQFTQALSDSDIIHLSMHAELNENDPMSSRLLFDVTGDKPIENLQLHELYNSQSSAQLAVLSACETGVGQYRGGAGVRSLANGFQYAGVPAVVTSLWKVPDESTSQIMNAFYGYLKEGKNKSESLKLAKLDYLSSTISEKQRHPFYWAGFILMGNTDSIVFSSGHNWIYYILAGLLFVVLLFVLRKRI